jgi:uncharacterized protein (DUF2062 family)
VPDWVRRHVPTQETVQRNRLLRPFAKPLSNPALWRLHRRSVPRAVALGLGVGVIIPFMHVAIAAILAIPARANVVISALVPLLLTPFYPALYYAAYRVGRWELRHDRGVVDSTTAQQVTGELQRILFWLHHASGPIALGILTLAIAIAVSGYVLAALLWRLWRGSKWRRRQNSRRGATA